MAKQMYVGEDFNPGALEELSKIPDGQPFAVINLNVYKEWAEYPEGTVTEKLTGQQAYERYAELSIPFVNKVGGVPMWRGNFGLVLIGPDEARWDEILIMQYPARSAFESMLVDPDYQAIVFHRTAAIKDSRLFGAISPESIGPMKWKIFNLSQKLRGR
ncbi:MAG: DUF1330 domain-containing protein [Arenicellales bacterium]|nr:DUF1330 domain-containing protein [Arenicellales bacterium]